MEREFAALLEQCRRGGIEVRVDSRQVSSGDIFVAVPGVNEDGGRFIPAAVAAGASIVVCRHGGAEEAAALAGGCRVVHHSAPREALWRLAEARWRTSELPLKIVGVTGTNGKTTCSYLLEQLFAQAGHKLGVMGTVSYRWPGHNEAAPLTTPDALSVHAMLAEMAKAGVDVAVMEVSSHAIDQQRVCGVPFSGAAFTNLTQDHLDYHKTFENYRDAKKAFFDGLSKDAFAITNADDKNGMIMVQNTKATVKTYSIRSMADFRARIIECHFEGMYLDIDNHEVGVQFIGKFNVSNLLAVYGAAVMLGKKPEDILLILSTLNSVSGRLEPIHSPEGYTAVVDYAHTPDALENVLNAIHEVLNGKGNVITVCGAGGNRDKGKRPLMAQEAIKQSDKVIITSDNPRFEEPQDIINDMLAGLNATQMKKVLTIVDRKEAIRTACMLANKGDVILVAGKGHEDYQEIKGVKHHFDDKEVLHDIFDAEK